MPVSTDSLTAKLLRALQIAALALLACVLAHYAAFGGPMQFVLWPAAALALAFGWLYSPIWAIPAAIGAGLWAYAHTSNIVMASGAIAASGLGPMLMVWLLIELGRRKPVEFRIDALLRFTLLAVLVCAPIDALLVAATLAIDSAADATQFTHWFAAWWLLDSVGLLLVVPATLSLWRQPSPSIRTRVAPALHLPSVIATLMIVLVTLQMSNMAQPKIGELALLLYLPVILLASLRLAERTLSLTLPITGAIILCTGSFLAANTPNGSLDIAAALLTLFCTQLALFVQAISADRRQALAKVSDHVRQDFTTGLLNDRGLLTELARQMSLPSRVHQGLIGIHITNFDTIHDLCGPIQAHALE
ncbi:MAG: MASE1 domain-containing protein, partial [Quisquiliibacterium sp.]